MTPAAIEQTRTWRAQDPPVSWRECARRLGLTVYFLRGAVEPEYKARVDAASAAYQVAKPERMSALYACWAEKNRPKKRVSSAKWDALNPESQLQRVDRRQAREAAAAGNGYTRDQLTWLKANVYTGGHCGYCQTYGCRLTVDHVVPLTRGGTHDPANLLLCCKPCNSSKSFKLLSEWRSGAHVGAVQLAIDAADLVRDVFGSK
jgi:5-methylcytosine-specific restriction endonuclease McrA